MWLEHAHPFARQCLETSHAGHFCSHLAGIALACLVADHVILGRVIFPGAGYLEIGKAIASHGGTTQENLAQIFFVQPLAVEVAGLHMECAMANSRLEVRSGTLSGNAATLDDTAVHCVANITAQDDWQRIEQASAHSDMCTSVVGLDLLYNSFSSVGWQYGPCFRTLAQAWGSSERATARLRARATHEGTAVHPADLDDGLCMAAMASSGDGDGETRLPFAVDEARLQGGGGELWAVRGFVAM
jgi:hypothetical protein